MTEPNNQVKGGIIIQGSLYWEDENNCMSGDESKGKARRNWRESHLNLKDAFPIPFPIRYGRCSKTREFTYTMVASREYLTPEKIGQSIVVPFQETFNSSTLDEIKGQIKELAKVEGISSSGTNFAIDPIAISIWINPNSNFKTELESFWDVLITHNGYQNNYTYDWTDKSLITNDYKLDFELDVKEIDFLLFTYMSPSHKTKFKRSYPTPQEIAQEINTSKYSTYFCLNRVNGITTSDDEVIFKHLGK